MPFKKLPSRPFAMVGYGIFCLLLLHINQQYHPVQCRPEFRHLHSQPDRPEVEQIKCLVHI